MLAAVNSVVVATMHASDKRSRRAWASSQRTNVSPNSSRPVVFGRLRRRKGCFIHSAKSFAEVLEDARLFVVCEQRPIHIRHERRALPARRHVAHTKIRDSLDARALRDDA